MLVCPTCGSNYTREQEHCGLDGTKLVRSDADPLIGRTIDKYRIEARLGSGGMATVYRARHEFLDKDYAIKVLHGQIAADSTMSRRFQREAKTLGQIKHPNVVSVDNFGATTAGLLYMVMEHIDGFTLSQTLRKQGPFAPGRAADIVRQIATGLQAAHRKGFVHRDLKPGNVMLMDDEIEGELVKLMDFGLVSIVSPDENHTQLTQDGQFFGTPMYMAPEQITGHPVTPATDLYALGVILHQMLSGEPPFTGDVKKLAFQHVQTDPPTLDSSYGGLADLSRTLMAKSVEDRPADAAEVISAIDTLALTPVSHPVQMPRSDSSAEPLGPEFAATIPYGSSDDDEAPLSRPILQEERAFRTAHEADAVLIDEALGQRSRRTPMLLFVLFLVAGGAVSLYYANGERFELDALQRLLPVPNQAPGASAPGEIRSTQPDEDSRNAPSAGSKDGDKDGANATGAGAAADRTNAEKNGAATDGANGAKAGTAATGGAGATAAKTGAAANTSAAAAKTSAAAAKTGAAAAKTGAAAAKTGAATPQGGMAQKGVATERKDAPAGSSAAPATADSSAQAGAHQRPAPPPDSAPIDLGPPRTFEELDVLLNEALSKRGLSLQDVVNREAGLVDRWTRWRESEGDPPPRRSEATFARLRRAVRELPLDDKLMARKVARVDRDLRVLKAIGNSGKQAVLRRQFNDIDRANRQRPRPKPLETLIAELTALEDEVAAAQAEPSASEDPPQSAAETSTTAPN